MCKDNVTNTGRNTNILLYFVSNALDIVGNAEQPLRKESASQNFLRGYLIFVFLFLFLSNETFSSVVVFQKEDPSHGKEFTAEKKIPYVWKQVTRLPQQPK